jgi:hypothetical protein
LLKHLLTALTFIVKLADTMLLLQTFPERWKLSHVVMIPKMTTSGLSVKDYHLEKIAEALILNRLQNFVERVTVIPYLPFGFRKGHSTT